MVVCASGSVSAHVYEAIESPAFRAASSPVAMPPQSSTKCRGLCGIENRGRCARVAVGYSSSAEILGGVGVPRGGVWGEIVAGLGGMGLGGDPAGMVVGPPILTSVFGKN